ncbi:MAG: sensor domain-containing diguanylate cyclase [Chloroflexota bacterium]
MSDRKKNGFTPQEHLISTLPAVIAGIVLLLAAMITAVIEHPPASKWAQYFLVGYGAIGSLYLAIFYLFFISRSKEKLLFAWINSFLGGVSLGLLTLILPPEMDSLLGIVMVVASVSSSLVSERPPAYFLVFSATLITLIIRFDEIEFIRQWVRYLSLAIVACISVETIQQLKYISRQQINRLEIVNEFSRQIASTLDVQQVTTLLNAAIQNALEADTYYVGMVEGDEIYLHLFYDDGEYFTDVRAKMEGTLSGWVIAHQQGLFLPDLRRDVTLAGVRTVIIGKQRTSLSWMGVPMQGEFTNGVIAIASYRPNAFSRADMELLSNMAQRAALALDNAFRHTMVEEQTHMDSLTEVYNHGYFIKVLKEQAQAALETKQPLSLIMLDIDHFKQYNDRYGHLAGDEILKKLCETIRRHVKRKDAIGRWGGEEFAISLPNTDGTQALHVADRIRQTMATLNLKNYNEETIPIPTVSQGIAEFPGEANEIFKLIDLADHRLYIAKERGRDQIEPRAQHWEHLSPPEAPSEQKDTA